jgi:hypothetical protein
VVWASSLSWHSCFFSYGAAGEYRLHAEVDSRCVHFNRRNSLKLLHEDGIASAVRHQFVVVPARALIGVAQMLKRFLDRTDQEGHLVTLKLGMPEFIALSLAANLMAIRFAPIRSYARSFYVQQSLVSSYQADTGSLLRFAGKSAMPDTSARRDDSTDMCNEGVRSDARQVWRTAFDNVHPGLSTKHNSCSSVTHY